MIIEFVFLFAVWCGVTCAVGGWIPACYAIYLGGCVCVWGGEIGGFAGDPESEVVLIYAC